jgi:hypothetical protein
MKTDITNLFPDCDAVDINVSLGNSDYDVSIGVSRDEDGVVTIIVANNAVGEQHEVVLGHEGVRPIAEDDQT